jgi:hypothetical protein
MIKYVAGILVAVIGIKYGVEYVTSPKFQEYGDKTKAPWTCQVNNVMGHLLMVMSNYDRAMYYFGETVRRCGDGPSGEVAEFETAECLSKLNHVRDAYVAYKAFVEKHPGTARAKIAERASQILQP